MHKLYIYNCKNFKTKCLTFMLIIYTHYTFVMVNSFKSKYFRFILIIDIYILFQEKPIVGYIRITNLFPSKLQKNFNRTSSVFIHINAM